MLSLGHERAVVTAINELVISIKNKQSPPVPMKMEGCGQQETMIRRSFEIMNKTGGTWAKTAQEPHLLPGGKNLNHIQKRAGRGHAEVTEALPT